MTDTTAASAAAGAEAAAAAEAAKTADPSTVEGLPDLAKKLITDARGEAAKYRTEKNAAVEAAKLEAGEAHKAELDKVSAEKATLQETVTATALELSKLRAALTAGVPAPKVAEVAALLQGSTDAELAAHAEKLKSLFGITNDAADAVDPTQGAGGAVKVDPGKGLSRLRAAYNS